MSDTRTRRKIVSPSRCSARWMLAPSQPSSASALCARTSSTAVGSWLAAAATEAIASASGSDHGLMVRSEVIHLSDRSGRRGGAHVDPDAVRPARRAALRVGRHLDVPGAGLPLDRGPDLAAERADRRAGAGLLPVRAEQ